MIEEKDLERKYWHEIHANEIVLLAYYIAAVNIENAFHDATLDPDDGIGKEKYIPFDGIVLTDTFQLGETDNSEKMFSEMFPQNSERVAKQKKSPLRVIIGNPPYSIGQNSANDNAQNQSYPILDGKIASTYAKESNAGLNKSLYDAYIKAFRWSSDRLDPKNGGIICFVSNGAWLDGNSTDGFRKSLEKEFSSIYVFNLRGNQRTNGELSRKEGGKIFGSGSRTPISVTLLVKNPEHNNERATIHYHDIGDYLTQQDKLNIIKKFGSIGNDSMQWKNLLPNDQGDWISQRNEAFDTFIPFEPAKKFDLKSQTFFNTYAIGVATNRDAWVSNFSKRQVENNIKSMITFYNEQQFDFTQAKLQNTKLEIEDFIASDPTKISWTRALRKDASKGINHTFKPQEFRISAYRPFTKQQLYFDKSFIESPGLNTKIFINHKSENIAISVTGLGSSKDFSALIVDSVPDVQLIMNGQIFPLYFYEERQKQSRGLFDEDGNSEFIRRDGVSDFILERAKAMYGKTVGKKDIFYYTYGLLHCPEYREMFASDLKKMLPRLPLMEDVRDFWKFSKAGRALAELHLNYESVPAYEGVTVTGNDSGFYTVEKMRYPKKDQKGTIHYNSKITITDIPAKAYEYVVNGKSAIDWIMERYAVTTHKDSGITNNPNDWADEVGNPRYILDLLLSVINVSVQTVDIVNDLPKVKFD